MIINKHKEKSSRHNKKWMLPFLSILSLVLTFLLALLETGPGFLPLITALAGLSLMIVWYSRVEKYYNWPVWFVLLLLTGIFFKRNHWPMAGAILTGGILFLCLTSLVNAVRFQFNMKNNPFLRWLGWIFCVTSSTYMFGWLVMVQHWSKEVGDIFGYAGIVLFIFSFIGMVFTLPNSNYLIWSTVERKTFYRSILMPMGIVYGLILITLVFSDAYFWLLDRRAPSLNLNYTIELFDLEGIM